MPSAILSCTSVKYVCDTMIFLSLIYSASCREAYNVGLRSIQPGAFSPLQRATIMYVNNTDSQSNECHNLDNVLILCIPAGI